MEITIHQAEVELAVKRYISSIMTLAPGSNFEIEFAATRGPKGFSASINVTPPDLVVAEPEQVVLTREPEKATESAAEASKTNTRKPRTLTVEQKAPEPAATAQEEEVATTAQAQAKEATSKQQGASADGDGQAVAVGGAGFPGFENENQDTGGKTDVGVTEQQAAKVETVSDGNNATTAEPSTRKSLFGGLGRPSNH